jgi:hypothetical protein
MDDRKPTILKGSLHLFSVTLTRDVIIRSPSIEGGEKRVRKKLFFLQCKP